jgi:hypothetical protein
VNCGSPTGSTWKVTPASGGWNAHLPLRCRAAAGLPSLTVSTYLIGSTPVGVQIIAGHFREDLCLLAGERSARHAGFSDRSRAGSGEGARAGSLTDFRHQKPSHEAFALHGFVVRLSLIW